MSQSAVQFANDHRAHVGLAVSEVARSTQFYKALFDVEPSKVRPGYARFEVAEPPLNLSIIQSSETSGPANRTSHYGIQVKSVAVVNHIRSRLESDGLSTMVEDSVQCCHAIQYKVWVVDPDGNRWEVYVVLDDAPTRDSSSKNVCCPTIDHETCCAENE